MSVESLVVTSLVLDRISDYKSERETMDSYPKNSINISHVNSTRIIHKDAPQIDFLVGSTPCLVLLYNLLGQSGHEVTAIALRRDIKI